MSNDSNKPIHLYNKLYKPGTEKKIKGLLQRQNEYLAKYDGDISQAENLDSIRQEILEMYKNIIIGSTLESDVIEDTNKSYKYISFDDYDKVKSTRFGDKNNIVRCELNRDDEDEVTIQKMISWSNKIAHGIEERLPRYMVSLGYAPAVSNKKQDTDQYEARRKQRESSFIRKIGSAYKKFTQEDTYKFNFSKVAGEVDKEDLDLNNTNDEDLTTVMKLMKEAGFENASKDKNAMKDFLRCFRAERFQEYFYSFKTNFSKDMLIKQKELDGDSILKVYYVKDPNIRDRKGRDTMRMVMCNEGEANRYIKGNDLICMTSGFKNSLKSEFVSDIINMYGPEFTDEQADRAIDNIINEKYKDNLISKKPMDAAHKILSATTVHLPEHEIKDFVITNGLKLEEAKTPTEKCFAFLGGPTENFGFGIPEGVPYEKSPIYRKFTEIARPVEKRVVENEKKTKSKKSNKEDI